VRGGFWANRVTERAFVSGKEGPERGCGAWWLYLPWVVV
jgi:hypothetical protein